MQGERAGRHRGGNQLLTCASDLEGLALTAFSGGMDASSTLSGVFDGLLISGLVSTKRFGFSSVSRAI